MVYKHGENLSQLPTIQNKIFAIIIFSKLNQALQKVQILHLDKLYKLEVAKLLFRFPNNALPSQFASLYDNVNKIHSYNATSSKDQKLFLPRRESSLALTRGGVEDTTFEAKTNDSKNSEAKDRLFEGRPFRGQGQEWSRPRIEDTIFLNYGRQISEIFSRESA